MAEVAVSIHGSHGSEYVLTVVFKRGASHHQSACAILVKVTLLLMLLSGVHGCSEPPTDPPSGVSSLMDQWMVAMSGEAAGFGAVQPPVWPDGLSMHQQAQVESFEIKVILVPSNGTDSAPPAEQVAFMGRMDRLAVRAESVSGDDDSGWAYDGIVRSDISVDSVSTESVSGLSAPDLQLAFSTITRDQQIQRMALGLGGVSGTRLWVGDDSVELTLKNPAASGGSGAGQCQRHYRWTGILSANHRLELNFPAQACPEAQTLGSLISWQDYLSDVSGTLITTDAKGGESKSFMHGSAWLRHTWGNLQATGSGAVVIDNLQIDLDGSQRLDVSRSKRRSGRGPKTVMATMQAADKVQESLDLQWQDSDALQVAVSGNAYPDTITLANVDKSIFLTVRVMNRLSESTELTGVQLSVPVLVSGTHTGAGFLSFTALPATP